MDCDSSSLPGVGDQNIGELIGGLGELCALLFEKKNLSGGNGLFEGANDDFIRETRANCELWDHGHAEIRCDHGECGFQLIALESFLGLLELARLEGLIAQAVTIRQMNEFLGGEFAWCWVAVTVGPLVAHGEGEEERFFEKEAALEAEASEVVLGDVAENGKLDLAIGDPANEIWSSIFTDFNLDARISGAKFSEKKREEIGGQGRNHPEGDLAGTELAAFFELLSEIRFFGKNALGVMEEDAARFRGDDSAPSSHEELFAQTFFELAYGETHCGLAHFAPLRGGAHGSGFHRFHKVMELFEINKFTGHGG